MCPRSTLEEMEKHDEVRVAWGTGIAGHVAESGEPVNIPDAYQVRVTLLCISGQVPADEINRLTENDNAIR